MSYGIAVWGGVSIKNINKVYLIQKRFIKAITYSPKGARCTPLFAQMKLLKLENVYKLFLLNVGFKYFKQNYCSNIFVSNQHIHNTRVANFLLRIPVSNCSTMANSPHFKVPSEWNSLVNSNDRNVIFNSNNTNSFKRSVKKIMFNNQV